MSQVLVTESHLQGIANAIRSKTGQSTSYTPAQMPDAIASIQGLDSMTLITKTFTENGVYYPNIYEADAFSAVTVDVTDTELPFANGVSF